MITTIKLLKAIVELINSVIDLLNKRTSTKTINIRKYKEIGKDLKKVMQDKNKERLIYKTFGIKTRPENYLLIEKSGIKKKYSDTQIKIASRFFIYSKEKLDVHIPLVDRFFGNICLVSVFFFFILGSIGLCISMVGSSELIVKLKNLVFSISCIGLTFWLLYWINSPLYLAKKIKKDLPDKVIYI